MGYMGSYYKIPKAIFYLLKGDKSPQDAPVLRNVQIISS